MVYEATDQTLDELLQTDYAAVDYYGTHCGPCKMLEPIYNEMSNDYATVSYTHLTLPTILRV